VAHRAALFRLVAADGATTASCTIENLDGLAICERLSCFFYYVIKPFFNSAWKPLATALACSCRWSHTTSACSGGWSHTVISCTSENLAGCWSCYM
jgi:hypothetical protein